MIWKQFLYNFMVLLKWTGKERFVLLNGPVPECLRLVHGKELPVPKGWNSLLPTWEPQVTIARNCRFPEVGTPGSQPGNPGLPLQATAGSLRLELMLPNLGTIGYHCKRTSVSSRLELMVPNVGTKGYHGKELPVPRPWNLRFPTWEPEVTIARNCRFPEVRIYVFEAKQLSL